jgi:uncharacterized membrane protein YhiD involved in acid resistance
MREFFEHALGLENVSGRHFAEILLRLAIAAVLGALVAYRPWRRFVSRISPPTIETAQAQTLIAVAGALMVAVIGDSMARAFGLVGLGAFIRFRSGIKDPRDAAVMFIMIGVGMACGLGLIVMALVATCFGIVVLLLFDATGKARPRRVKLSVEVDDAKAALPQLRAAFPAARVIGAPNTAPERGKVVFELTASEDVDAAVILETLELKGITGVRNVALEED